MTLAGIQIGVHSSWLIIALLLSWTLITGYFPYHFPGQSRGIYAFMGIVAMLGLFVCVILHELGHALVAKYYRLPISQITLFIFGGVAEIKKEPQSPKVEFLVAIAGPIVSAILAFLMALVTAIGTNIKAPVVLVGITQYLTLVNTAIALFNLIPAFPLDGGRLLRALLWILKKDLRWATKIATKIGAGFAFVLIVLGAVSLVYGDWLTGIWFVILGLFLRGAAKSSETQFFVTEALRGEHVTKFMTKNPIAVSPAMTLQSFLDDVVYTSPHQLYPVTEEGHLVGYITLHEVKMRVPETWPRTTIGEVMVPLSGCKVASPTTSALGALQIMQDLELPSLLVVDKGRLVGLVSAADLFKTVLLKLEMEERR